MGLFDVFKKKEKDAVDLIGVPGPAPARPSPPSRPAPRGPTFTWEGYVLPLPPGWDNLSMDDWFLKLEQTKDRISHAHEERLEPMLDAEGNPLSPEEVLLVKLGFQDGGHWEKFCNWGYYRWAESSGESPMDLMFRMSGIAREKIMAAKAASMSGPGGMLAPVEGVALKDWARVQAIVASGGDLAAELARLRIDGAKWDRVNNEWLARMQTDTTFTIANEYGAAFAAGSSNAYGAHAAHAASAGVGGDLSAEPMPYERYVEIMEASSASAQRGEDPIALLASFGLSTADWGNVGMYWSKRTQQEATKYHQLYCEYSEKYRRKYAGA